MKNIKFLVRLTRIGSMAGAHYVQRIDRKTIQTTIERKLALLMGRVTAMEVVESLGKSRWIPEVVAVQVDGERHFVHPELLPQVSSALSV